MDATGAFGVTDEAEVGIFGFTSYDFRALGGVIKEAPEDFRVWELRLDGTVVRPPRVSPSFAKLDATSAMKPPKGGRKWAGEGSTDAPDPGPDRVVPGSVSNAADKRVDCDQLKPDPHESGSYISFVMWKRCTDTLEALGALANTLRVPVGCFGFAGIKDSCAVTAQDITIPLHVESSGTRFQITPQMLHDAAQECGEHLRLGEFGTTDWHLRPGHLKGNRFRIRIRRATLALPHCHQNLSEEREWEQQFREEVLEEEASEDDSDPKSAEAQQGEAVEPRSCKRSRTVVQQLSKGNDDLNESRLALQLALHSIWRRGFVNYVGMQRFGKAGVRSDLVGRAYLQRDYERCVDLILFGPPEGGSKLGAPVAVGGRKQWKPQLPRWAEAFRTSWSADAALRLMTDSGRSRFWVERRILQVIRLLQREASAQDGEDLGTSLLPARFQGGHVSWYEMCRRAFLGLPRSIRMLYAYSYCDRLWNICASERVAMGVDRPIEGDLVWVDQENRQVRALKREELGDYSVFDVLLPRPGVDVLRPANTIGSLMSQYLTYDDLDGSLEDFAIEELPTDTDKLQMKALARDLDCESSEDEERQAQDDDAVFWPLSGDYRYLLCRPENLRWSFGREQPDEASCKRTSTFALDDLYDVTLTFDLPRGSYATMMMRELMHGRGSRTARGHGAPTCRNGDTDGKIMANGHSRHIVWDSDDDDALEN